MRGVNCSQILQAALRRGYKRMEYRSEEGEEEGSGGSEDNRSDGEQQVEVSEKEGPPSKKRQRQQGMGDGWKKVTPIKWRQSPLGKGKVAFASLPPSLRNAGLRHAIPSLQLFLRKSFGKPIPSLP